MASPLRLTFWEVPSDIDPGIRTRKSAISIRKSKAKTRRNKRTQGPYPTTRNPRLLTDYRKRKIRNFVTRNNSNPVMYPFGKIGSETWIKELIKFMKEPNYHKVIPSDIHYWLRSGLVGFFHMEHVKTALCSEQKCSGYDSQCSTLVQSDSDSGRSDDLTSGNTDEQESDDPCASSPCQASEPDVTVATDQNAVQAFPRQGEAATTITRVLSPNDQSISIILRRAGRPETPYALPNLLFTFRNFDDVKSVLQHLLDNYIDTGAFDLENVKVIATILTKLVRRARELGTYPDANLRVCCHALQCMNITLTGMVPKA